MIVVAASDAAVFWLAASCRFDGRWAGLARILKQFFGTRDRTNVYMKLWRRLGVVIGGGKFAFILYRCL